MELKLTEFDPAAYMKSPESIFAFLEAELDEDDACCHAETVAIIARARGGFSQLAAETGLSATALTAAAQMPGIPDRALIQALLEAYRRFVPATALVA